MVKKNIADQSKFVLKATKHGDAEYVIFVTVWIQAIEEHSPCGNCFIR
jgi:hypothetical protein